MKDQAVEVDGNTARYGIPNQATKWRVETLFTKEEDTIAWIDSFEPKEVMMDIGANVGMFTIYAAAIRDINVVAFEPEADNFQLLQWNIRHNQLDNLVTAYPLAMSARETFTRFYLSQVGVGGSGHTAGQPLTQELTRRAWTASQGTFSTTIGAFCRSTFCYPHHIKIDVDALEHRIVEGATWLLRDHPPKSWLIEINTKLDEHRKIFKTMDEFGYDVTTAPGAIRGPGPFEGIGNHIFRRRV